MPIGLAWVGPGCAVTRVRRNGTAWPARGAADAWLPVGVRRDALLDRCPAQGLNPS